MLAIVTLSAPCLTQTPRAVATSARVFAKGEWVEVARVADGDARLLTNPRLLATRGDVVYVYDAGTQQVLAIHHDGRLRWRVGRGGKGPGEFSNPVDLQIGANGAVHVLDADLSRITILSPSGDVIEMKSIQGPLHRIVPRNSGWWAVALTRPDLLVSVNADGKLGAGVAAPDDVARHQILVREPKVASLGSGGAIVAFVWSSRVLVVDSAGRLAADLEGPENIPFPATRSYRIEHPQFPQGATVERIDPQARTGARLLAANDTAALVSFGGPTRSRVRVLDRYDLRAARYVDSSRLPGEPSALRLLGDRLVVLELDPAPAIVFYEWKKS
ncbi:MAG: 6-bladed beta-propeller [Gemmatimonadaceae bacterium]